MNNVDIGFADFPTEEDGELVLSILNNLTTLPYSLRYPYALSEIQQLGDPRLIAFLLTVMSDLIPPETTEENSDPAS